MYEEDLKERQEFEVEAIKAIYLTDVTDLRENEDDQPYLSIRLLPQRGSSGGINQNFSPTTVLLTVKFPSNYPNLAPEISISESKGLSSQEVLELTQELDKLAIASVGEVMVLNLAQFAEGYLYVHQKIPVGSFYDEMLLRKKKLQEQTNQRQQEHLEKERIAIREEIQRKQDALKEELRRRKEEWKAQNEILTTISPPQSYQSSPVKGDGFPQNVSSTLAKHKKRRSISLRRRRSTSEGSDSSLSEYSDIITLDFSCNKVIRRFQRGEVLGESEKGNKVYVGMDCTSGGLVTISEWIFTLGKKDKKGRIVKEIGSGEGQPLTYESVMKQLNAFESEFNLLQKLEHPNIVLYLGIKTVTEDPGNVCLYVAQEFIRGTTLQSYLQDTLTLDVAIVRHCAHGILQALDYLHSNNVVHRFLRDTCVFMDTTGEVKVGDYGLERKICELYQTAVGNQDALVDKFPPSIGRGAKKGDIYRFGVLILSLLRGQYVAENPPDIPSSFSPELQDFLKKCLTTSEHARWTAPQLLEHTFIKMQIQKGLILRCREDDSRGHAKKETDDHDKEVDTPTFNLPLCKGISRLQNEFEVLLWLGRGGFGDVLKVKNKLDGGIYALKRIRLNPRNKQLNKKITREVKLLSQLNHENVVRYYNSWIETVIDCASEFGSSSAPTASTPGTNLSTFHHKTPHSVRFNLDNLHQNSLGLQDNVEDLAPPCKESEWSISIRDATETTYESDESSEEEDIFGTSFLHLGNDESDDIVFESESGNLYAQDESTNEVSNKNTGELEIRSEKVKENHDIDDKECIMSEIQFMYIQMEFCEKSTLRTAIDCGLYQDGDRVWRLFREIVEGLVHIHQQGMIHRDLKPVNIFLDSYDHVKIGDFGLATTNILNKGSDNTVLYEVPKVDMHQSMDFGEESMTGHVGTALYVAPELITTAGTKALYNQKVDIYSLGVILFEMFYRPLETGMERVRVIAGLRQSDIAFPQDFDEQLLPQVSFILRWILNHDPSKRPTSVELLQSDYMPPPLMEEAELQDVFRHTLANPQSKAYKYLVASCFKQNVSAAEDITYNYGMGKLSNVITDSDDQFVSVSLIQKVKKIIQNVFEHHSAVELGTPLLTPKSDMYEHHNASAHLMSHSGSVVTLPFDLRVPFARYVVWNKITNMKRYSITKVFRENKVYGYHPTELYECAFDVISSSKGTLVSDAEVLSVTFEIINELPWMRDKHLTIRLSHTNFLDAVLLHYAIDEKYYSEIKCILSAVKGEKNSRSQVQTHLVSLCLPDQFISLLFTLMEIEGPLAKVSNIFKGILRKKGLPASKIKEALHELEVLIGHLDSFGLKCEIVVTPSVVFGTNIYTGLLFQVVCNLKKRKNKQTVDVIAVGGRYDSLIEKFRSTLEMYGQTSKDVTQCGVGISISLDKLVAGLETEEREKIGAYRSAEVLICSLGHHPMSREKIILLKDFLAHGIQCSLLDESQTLESAEEHCRQIGALFLVILKETEDLRIRSWERDRFQERRIMKSEVVDFILRTRRASHETNDTWGSGSIMKSEGLSSRVNGQLTESNGVMGFQPASTNLPAVNISFVIQEKDKIANWKRRYENQMMSHIESVLPKLSKQQIIELMGLDVNNLIIKSLTSLQLQDKEEYSKSVSEVIEKHPRHKKYLKSICDEIFELAFEKEKGASVIIVYGLIDNYFRVLM